jgi:hypothetical protein
MPTKIAFQGPGLTPDLEKSLSCMLEDAMSRVVAEFSDLGSSPLFEKTAFSVTVLGQPTPQCSASTIRVTTTPGRADILLVSPTVHSDRTPDGFSRSYDRVWYHKNLVHECTAVFMWHYAPASPHWSLNDAPTWFIEGLQEFVAIERGPAEARGRYRERYLPRLHEETVRQRFSSVEDAYADGYLILLFLHDEYGTSPVHEVLKRSEPTFWRSVERSLAVDREELFQRWLAWKSRGSPRT